METKICTKCKRELSINEFNWRSKKNGTRRSECKYCHTKYMNDAISNKRNMVAQIKSMLKCQKCGEGRSYTLDFHHLNPNEKENTVARLVSNTSSITKVLEEIKKCAVLCANCHREFHYLNDNYNLSLNDYMSGAYDTKNTT